MKKLKLPKPGTKFGGGFFAGRFFIGDQAYALVVAPKAKGEVEPMRWNESMAMVAGATSHCDGLANTQAMAKAGSDLAKKITGLKIGKASDWYLPSRLELLLAYSELRNVKAFAAGGKQAFERAWYWSSTQHAEYAESAWSQFFGYGGQDGWHKDHYTRARAVRRIKI